MILQTFSVSDLEVGFREATVDDLESVWLLFSSLNGERRATLPPFNRRLIEHWNENIDNFTFKPVLAFIEEGGVERIIGHAMLTHDLSPATKHRAELGIVIHDDFQGKGIGSNLVLFMVHLARSRGLHKLTLDVFGSNPRAIHVFESCGFTREGVFVDHYWFRGKFYDVVRMGLFL
jgi:RimJ/RimL family protein N-acetyltransferase